MRTIGLLIGVIVAGLYAGDVLRGDDAVPKKTEPVAKKAADGWRPLFNGKDLKGWKGNGSTLDEWKIVDGVLSSPDMGGGGGWIHTSAEYKNFKVKLEFRVSEGANSGLFLRAPKSGMPHVDGLEIQIVDDGDSDVVTTKSCGSLLLEVGPSKRASKKAGEWQTMEVECIGSNVRVDLNGERIVDVDLSKTEALDDHPGRTRTGGYIGLQDRGERVEFRQLFIKELK